MTLKYILLSLLDTLFPSTCAVCGIRLCDSDNFMCSGCMSSLPETNNWFEWENTLKLQLEAIFPNIKGAVAFLYYNPADNHSRIIHNIKYRNQRKLAYEMGRLFALHLVNSPITRDIDCIVPLPLHSSREKWRGYNQSELIAYGIASVLDKEVVSSAVIRNRKGKSQASIKNNSKRLENIKDSFTVIDKRILKNKKILLVDDVITTGATLSSCAIAIYKSVPTCEIIATSLAYRK